MIYNVTLTDGQTFRIRADMVEASAPIAADFFGDGEWQPTPFQTANARHDAKEAARLVAEYFTTGPHDCVTVRSVEAWGDR